MAANLRNGPPTERRTPMSGFGGTLAIAFGLRRGRAFQFSARRRAAWMILDLRRSRASAKLRAVLPHGLPFAMGLSPLLSAWSRAARLGQVVATPGAPTAERVPNRTLQPRTMQIGSGTRSGGLWWIPGFVFAHRVGPVPAAVPAARAAGVSGALPELTAAAPRSSDEGQRPAMQERGPEPVPDRRLGPMPTDGDPTLRARSRSAEGAPTAGATLAPVWATVQRREMPRATSAPPDDRPRRTPARDGEIAASPPGTTTAAWRSRIARSEPAAHATANLNRIQQSESGQPPGAPRQTGLPWFSLAAATASSALPAAAMAGHGRDRPASDLAHAQRRAEPAAQNESMAVTMRTPALSVLADPLHQLVSREVSKQLAAAARTAPLSPSPSPSPQAAGRAPVTDSHSPSDDFARRLLSKMRAISREERFRGGYLR